MTLADLIRKQAQSLKIELAPDHSKLEAILRLIEARDYESVTNKIARAIRAKVDGTVSCKRKNDWIADSRIQLEISSVIDGLLTSLMILPEVVKPNGDLDQT